MSLQTPPQIPQVSSSASVQPRPENDQLAAGPSVSVTFNSVLRDVQKLSRPIVARTIELCKSTDPSIVFDRVPSWTKTVELIPFAGHTLLVGGLLFVNVLLTAVIYILLLTITVCSGLVKFSMTALNWLCPVRNGVQGLIEEWLAEVKLLNPSPTADSPNSGGSINDRGEIEMEVGESKDKGKGRLERVEEEEDERKSEVEGSEWVGTQEPVVVKSPRSN